MLPSLFIAHGAPLLAIEDHEYTRFLQQLGKELPRPKAIILFSAHYESVTQQVSDVDTFDTIYDFGGFSEKLYRIKYPAKGDKTVTAQIADRFSQLGIHYEIDQKRGLDHGAWVVLSLLYPEADIPVVSLSVNSRLTPQQQFEIGKALSDLRQEDYLIVASGGTVHNLRAVRLNETNGEVVDSWAREFEEWVAFQMEDWNLEALFNYESLAPYAELAVPPRQREHFIPIFYAMGAAGEEQQATLLHQSFRYGNLSHSVWRFGK